MTFIFWPPNASLSLKIDQILTGSDSRQTWSTQTIYQKVRLRQVWLISQTLLFQTPVQLYTAKLLPQLTCRCMNPGTHDQIVLCHRGRPTFSRRLSAKWKNVKSRNMARPHLEKRGLMVLLNLRFVRIGLENMEPSTHNNADHFTLK